MFVLFSEAIDVIVGKGEVEDASPFSLAKEEGAMEEGKGAPAGEASEERANVVAARSSCRIRDIMW